MLKEIEIINFESWKKATLKLSPGVNTIIGESDQGKSGIVRALKWNMKNRPQGDEFRGDYLTEKKDKVSVKTIYDDDSIIIRERDAIGGAKGVNNYIVNGTKLAALRADLPYEVNSIAKIKDVNIQSQHPSEQYFLLTEKPGEVAKMFNKVAGLSIMDESLSEINSRVREAKSNLTYCQNEITNLETKIKNGEWIPKALLMKEKIQILISRIEKEKEGKEKLKKLFNSIYIIKALLTKYSKLDSAKAELKNIYGIDLKLSQSKQKLTPLSDCLIKAKRISPLIKDQNLFISSKKELKKLEDQFSEFAKNKQKRNTIKELAKHAEKLSSNIIEPELLIKAKNEILTLRTLQSDIKLKIAEKDKMIPIILHLKTKNEEVKESKDYLEKCRMVYNKTRSTTICPVCGRGDK